MELNKGDRLKITLHIVLFHLSISFIVILKTFEFGFDFADIFVNIDSALCRIVDSALCGIAQRVKKLVRLSLASLKITISFL
jgi:hypothetical protein